MNPQTRLAIAASLTAGAAFLASCNMPRPPSPEQIAQTAAAETAFAQRTQASLATPTVPPTDTPPPPTPTITPTPSPRPTATVDCDDSLQFISDVSIPDNTVMTPGQSFTKTWRLRNTGNCDWTPAFEAVFIEGASMGAPAAVPLPGTVPSDGTIDISVKMTAPTSNGAYRGNYRMRNAGGALFGSPFYVQILVGPTPTPTLAVHRTGTVTIDNGGSIDLDSGNSAGDPNRDVWVHYVSDSERYLEPTNGALLKVMSGTPSYETCKESSLDSGAVSFTDFGSQSDFCYRTSDGRYGRFQIEKVEGDSVGFDFRTWD